MKAVFGCILFLTAINAFADVWTLRTPSRNSSEPDWNAHFDSDHFAVWYSTQYPCTEAQANTALKHLENVLDFYVNQKKFATAILNRNPNYKVNCCIIENGLYGGLDAQGNPSMWIGVGGLTDQWGLAHEFTHALQGVTGGFKGGRENYSGWFWECHANWMPHQLYPDNPHCTEMYLRMSNLYYGSHRCRYCNWQFLEYLKEKKGFQFINDLWEKSGTDVIETIMKNGGWDVYSFGDIFADFTSKNITWEYQNGAVYRSIYSSQPSRNKWRWFTYLQELDTAHNRYSVPFEFAPQRYGYNIVRLFPSSGSTKIKIRFRGCVQTANANSSYKSANQWEPVSIPLPGSDWRYLLVTINSSGITGYSEIKRFSDGAPDLSSDLPDVKEVYLVVVATPTVYARILWDQMYYTVYRYPWMVEIEGAKPQGFEPITVAGKIHPNGGGFVANTATVAATAYVGPFARVLGGNVEGNARIEDRAIIKGGTVGGNAIVKGNSMVAGGSLSGSAIVADNAAVWSGTITDSGRADGSANINQVTIKDKGRIGGVCWVLANVTISGTAQLLGDGEIVNSKSSGVHYGLIDNSTEGNIGNNRITPVREVTKQGPFEWYEKVSAMVPKKTPKIQAALSLYRDNIGRVHIRSGRSLIKPSFVILTDLRGRMIWNGYISNKELIIHPKISSGNLIIWKMHSETGNDFGTLAFTQ